MKKLYRLNRERGTLHIYGCCQYSTNPDYEQYDSEKEVDAAVGYHIPLCIRCQQWRDYVLRKELLKSEMRRNSK